MTLLAATFFVEALALTTGLTAGLTAVLTFTGFALVVVDLEVVGFFKFEIPWDFKPATGGTTAEPVVLPVFWVDFPRADVVVLVMPFLGGRLQVALVLIPHFCAAAILHGKKQSGSMAAMNATLVNYISK